MPRDLETSSVPMYRASVAWMLGIGLVAIAAATGWAAALLHDPHGVDPHWSGVGTAALFAAGFVVRAEWSLLTFGRARTSGWVAAGWTALAVLSLVVVLAVAEAGNLGG